MDELLYLKAEKYLEENEKPATDLLREFDDLLIEGRDGKQHIPIYLTKYRVKKLNSIYLKIKKSDDINDPSQVTDFAGIRVLCLFEKDILEVHEYLIKSFFKNLSST